MDLKSSTPQPRLTVNADATAQLITKCQLQSGEIPWSIDGKTDPWDMVEAIMGLTIGGYYHEARLAFDWLVKMQLEDGSWFASYIMGKPEDRTRDTNMSSYIAVGVLHFYLITKDNDFLVEMWPTVKNAIDFIMAFQAQNGEIYWAKNPEGIMDQTALLTGSSSVFMSLKCALLIAHHLNQKEPRWEQALKRLGEAIRYRPHLFNVTKSRYSMDWFYPILSGALRGAAAQKRIDKYWKKFVVEGLGVRCVSDEPWITIAETSELVMALWAMGNQGLAEIVFNWIQNKLFDDGSYWCGFVFPEIILWPEEKMTWTNAVALMAADALYGITPANFLFSHDFWRHSPLAPLI